MLLIIILVLCVPLWRVNNSFILVSMEMAILPASLKGIPMLLKRNILDLYIVIVM
jgi:hypothetical protein